MVNVIKIATLNKTFSLSNILYNIDVMWNFIIKLQLNNKEEEAIEFNFARLLQNNAFYRNLAFYKTCVSLGLLQNNICRSIFQ